MTTNLKSFEDFGVEEKIGHALSDAGISTPFPIQELTLPLALTGADIIGQARTGTGKTLAFGIPLLQRVDPDAGAVQALVIVPTRELCLQVTGDLNAAGVRKGVDVVAVYGGRAIEPQVEAIESGASIVVGTPGRLLDLMRRGNLRLNRVQGLVLDEADEMLDLGFLPDVEQLIEATATDRQTMLFSATMPSQVVALARRYMRKPTFLRADVEEIHVAPETTQYFFSCHRMDKPAVLARMLQTPNRGLCLVFSRTKRMADILAEELRGRGIAASPIHSDLRQEAREKALARFRSGKIDVLVATEVAARGLDIIDVTHVVNYDCPDDEKMYLHRIGRTGRAGAAGVAITLAVWNELARLEMIKRALDITSIETHEVFSTSPILDELFDLPARTPRRPVVDDAEDEEETEQAESPAAPAVAPALAPASQDGQAERKRRRRRRGRGRPAELGVTATEQTPDDDRAMPAAPPLAMADADKASSPVAAETPEEAPVRQDVAAAGRRSRIRQRFSRRPAEAPAPVAGRMPADGGGEVAHQPSAVAPVDGLVEVVYDAPGDDEVPVADEATVDGDTRGPAPAGEGSEGDRRTRVRRRTARTPSAREQPSQPPTRRARAEEPNTPERRTRRRTPSSPAPAAAAARRTGSRTRREPDRSRSGSSARSAGGWERPAEQPDVTTARGPGKPTLARPMGITHLP